MSSRTNTMCAEETEFWLQAARDLLIKQGRCVDTLFHRQIVHARTHAITNLYRGRERGETVRFLGLVDAEGKLADLQPLSSRQRKDVGNDGHVHTVENPGFFNHRVPPARRMAPLPLLPLVSTTTVREAPAVAPLHVSRVSTGDARVVVRRRTQSLAAAE